MSLTHRHLDNACGAVPEELSAAALDDFLDRGDLEDWWPLARAIEQDPRGDLSARVLRLLDAHPMYGTEPLWRTWIARCRLRAHHRPASLAELRTASGLSQAEMASEPVSASRSSHARRPAGIRDWRPSSATSPHSVARPRSPPGSVTPPSTSRL